jgi:hypothetical protein
MAILENYFHNVNFLNMYYIMEVKSILLFVIVVVLLIVLIRYIMKDVNTLTGLVSAQTMQKIEPSSLSSSSTSGNTSNFTYSIWFFIDDWNYRYGDTKIIFGRMTTGTGKREPCPSVALGPLQNNVAVSLAVYPGLDEEPQDGNNFIVHTCGIANVPIQRWSNLFISVYGRTLDLYLDGKLVRTCVLPGVAKIDPNAPIYVTPKGGFSGWTSNFQYWPEASNPQTAWNVYKAGYGGSLLGSIFGKYTIKVSLMEGDVEDTSVTI